MARLQGVKRPTSRDVARLAGVSHTTVSFVINEVPTANISAETRARVQAAIRELDYQPHEVARSLSRQASREIGVVIPDATNLHFVEITAGIEGYAARHGYSVSVAESRFDVAVERHSLGWLKQKRVDALIFCSPCGTDWHPDARQLLRQGYTITTLGEGIPDTTIDMANSMTHTGERSVLTYLVELGHRRIGYIYGVFNHQLLGARLAHCLEAQRELGIPIVEHWVRRCGPTLDDGYRATRALLDECPPTERPTALIVVNDHLAVAVLSALYHAGLAVPAEMSVVGFDNTLLAQYTTPSLTTVDPNARLMGEYAAQLTIDRLRNSDRAPVHMQTEPHLIIRGSTGPVPQERG